MICSNYKKALFGLIVLAFGFAHAMEQRDPAKKGQPRKGSVRVRFFIANTSGIDYALEGTKVGKNGVKSILGAAKANLQVPVGAKHDDTKFHLALGKETDGADYQEKQELCIKLKDSSRQVFTFVNEARPVPGKTGEYVFTGTLSDGQNTKTVTRIVTKRAHNDAGEVRIQLTLGATIEDSLVELRLR